MSDDVIPLNEIGKIGTVKVYNQAYVDKLEKQISILLSCKDCPDNKGGYICEKEYNDKCLSQKIQYIKELKEENAELEKQIVDLKDYVFKVSKFIHNFVLLLLKKILKCI